MTGRDADSSRISDAGACFSRGQAIGCRLLKDREDWVMYRLAGSVIDQWTTLRFPSVGPFQAVSRTRWLVRCDRYGIP